MSSAMADFEILLKGALLFAEAVYVAFAFIQTRQVKLMNVAFQSPHAKLFNSLTKVHLILAIGAFLLSIAILL